MGFYNGSRRPLFEMDDISVSPSAFIRMPFTISKFITSPTMLPA